RQIGDETCPPLRRKLRQVLAQKPDGTVSRVLSRDGPHQRRFSRTVGPKKPHNLAGLDGKAHRTQDAPSGELHHDILDFQRHAASLRVRTTSQRKNGAPMRAVTTPTLSSPAGSTTRQTVSAASSSAPPPRPEGRSSRSGHPSVYGRRSRSPTRLN